MIQIPSSEDVLRELHADIGLIGQCVDKGWRSYTELYTPALRARHQPRSRANLINDEIIIAAEETFAGRAGVRTDWINGMFVVFFQANLMVRFKKFDDEFRVSNIPTKQAMEYVGQQFSLPEVGKLVSLFAGYRLNELETDLEGIYLACPRHRSALHWIEQLQRPQNNIVSIPASKPAAAGFKLRIEKRDEGADAGES